MKKLITLTMLMLAFVSGAWADEYSRTLTSAQASAINGGTNPYTFTDGAKETWTFVGTFNGSTGEYVKFKETSMTLTISGAGITGPVHKVTIQNYVGGTSTTTVDVKVDGVTFGSTGVMGAKGGDRQTVISGTGTATSGVIEITFTDGNTKGMYIAGVTVEYGTVDTRTNLVGEWSNAAPTFDKGDTPTIPAFSVTGGTIGTDYSVAYALTTDGGNVSVNSSTGITAINTANPGISVVKATITVLNTTDYKATTTEYSTTITVNDALSAVTNKFWNFSESGFTAISSVLTSPVIVDNIELADGIKVQSGSKSIDGYDFTSYVTPGGASQNKSERHRYIHFKVAANCVITVYGMSGSSGSNRSFGIKIGDMVYTQATSDATAYVTNNGKVIDKLVYQYTGSETDVYVYAIDATCWFFGINVSTTGVEVNIPSSGLGSFSCNYPVEVPTGITAYYADEITASSVSLKEITGNIPANQGVLLSGTAGRYTLPLASTAAAIVDNELSAAVNATAVDANAAYILQGGKFHKVTSASTIPAGKAYLLASKVPAEANELTFSFDDTTGIGAAFNDDVEMINDNVIYDLSGRRVENPTKGIYIINGKKVVIR